MSRIRPVAAGLPVLLAVALAACSLLDPEEAPPPGPSIEGGSPDGPHSLSVAAVSVWSLPEALAAAGLGLRVAEGERGDLRLRYTLIPGEAAGDLERRLGVLPWSYSGRARFAGRDDLSVTALRSTEPPRGFTLTVRPQVAGDRLAALEVVALARPDDGSLLPAIRGRVPVDGPGRFLIVGESREVFVFAALLDVETPGPPATPTTGHVLALAAFRIGTEDLARVLRNAGVEETGGPGGFAARKVSPAEAAVLAAGLAEGGTALEAARVAFVPGRPVSLTAGPLRLEILPEFRRADYEYRHAIAVLNRDGVPPLAVAQGERESILFLAFDALAPGLSLAAVLAATPAR